MNKKELIEAVTHVLKDNDIRKHVAAQKTVLHISDDSGNNSDFIIRKSDKGLLFTNKDVHAVVDAIIAVIEDSIKHGEEVSVHGFGTLGLKYREARRTKHPDTGEDINIEGRYTPKFTYGNSLRTAAQVFGLSIKESQSIYGNRS